MKKGLVVGICFLFIILMLSFVSAVTKQYITNDVSCSSAGLFSLGILNGDIHGGLESFIGSSSVTTFVNGYVQRAQSLLGSASPSMCLSSNSINLWSDEHANANDCSDSNVCRSWGVLVGGYLYAGSGVVSSQGILIGAYSSSSEHVTSHGSSVVCKLWNDAKDGSSYDNFRSSNNFKRLSTYGDNCIIATYAYGSVSDRSGEGDNICPPIYDNSHCVAKSWNFGGSNSLDPGVYIMAMGIRTAAPFNRDDYAQSHLFPAGSFPTPNTFYKSPPYKNSAPFYIISNRMLTASEIRSNFPNSEIENHFCEAAGYDKHPTATTNTCCGNDASDVGLVDSGYYCKDSSWQLLKDDDAACVANYECANSYCCAKSCSNKACVAPDTTAPTYSLASHNSTASNKIVKFSLYVNDNLALNPNGQYIFSTNNTGSWVNNTAVKFTTTPSWANVTKVLNSIVGTKVGYMWYFNDTSGNIKSTPISFLTTTTTTTTTGCIDSDVSTTYPDGKNYYEKGVTTFGTTIVSTDSCYQKVLKEFYCSNNFPVSEFYTCPNSCSEGRCSNCGDGDVDTGEGEECDDGNTVNDDACSNDCKLPSCDDEIKNGDEDGIDCGGSSCDDCSPWEKYYTCETCTDNSYTWCKTTGTCVSTGCPNSQQINFKTNCPILLVCKENVANSFKELERIPTPYISRVTDIISFKCRNFNFNLIEASNLRLLGKSFTIENKRVIQILDISSADPDEGARLDFNITKKEILSSNNAIFYTWDETSESWEELDFELSKSTANYYIYSVYPEHFSLFLIAEEEYCGNNIFDAADEDCDGTAISGESNCTSECVCEEDYISDGKGGCAEDILDTECLKKGDEKCTGYNLYECGSDLKLDKIGIVIGECGVECSPVGNMSCQGEYPLRCGSDYQWDIQSKTTGLCGYVSTIASTYATSGDDDDDGVLEYCGNGYCGYDEDESTCPEDCTEEDASRRWMLPFVIAVVSLLILLIIIVLSKIYRRESKGPMPPPNRGIPPMHRPGPKRDPGRPLEHNLPVGRPPIMRQSPQGYSVRRYPPPR